MSGLLSDEYVDARARECESQVSRSAFIYWKQLDFWNQGVDVMVKKLVPGIETSRVAVGGATLETLWNNDEARLASPTRTSSCCRRDLPETSRESFRRHAKLWCDHVRKERRRAGLLRGVGLTACRRSTTICAEHEKVAAENNARIAHVGAARTAAPEHLNLFDDDREHPSLAGTYLAARHRGDGRAPRRSGRPRCAGRRTCRSARRLYSEGRGPVPVCTMTSSLVKMMRREARVEGRDEQQPRSPIAGRGRARAARERLRLGLDRLALRDVALGGLLVEAAGRSACMEIDR